MLKNKFFKKTIIAHFLTTINFQMALKASGFLFLPWKWHTFYNGKGKNDFVKNIENKLLKFLNLENSKIISFYNGRSAIFHGIKLLGIGKNDEILTQAFSCISVSNSIIQSGAFPIYCDVDGSLNISFEEIKKKYTKKTKAVLVQNTFGNPADLENIKKFCEEKKIFLIEDCAHSLGAMFKGKKTGGFGDVSIFSFGRDKVVSSINGGFLIINNKKFFTNIEEKILNNLKNISLKELLKNLIYIIISFKSKVFYDFFGLGKVFLFLGRKLKLSPDVLSNAEKKCEEKRLNYRYPNALAEIGEMEFKNLEKINLHREKIFKIYKNFFKGNKKIFFAKKNFLEDTKNFSKNKSVNGLLRIPVFIKNSRKIMKLGKKEKIIFGDRYKNTIDPIGSSFKDAKYEKGSCKNAEKYAEEVVNLPNHFGVSEKDALRVCNFLEKNL